jgi:hypothetical protein
VDYGNFLARHRVLDACVARRARRSLPSTETRDPVDRHQSPRYHNPARVLAFLLDLRHSRHCSAEPVASSASSSPSPTVRDGLQQHRRLHAVASARAMLLCLTRPVPRALKPALAPARRCSGLTDCRSRRRIRPHDRRCRPDGSIQRMPRARFRRSPEAALSASEGGIPIGAALFASDGACAAAAYDAAGMAQDRMRSTMPVSSAAIAIR